MITLSIIGVVSALTIPSLVANHQEKETITRLKKAYSVLTEAFKLAEIQYGNVATWNWGTQENPSWSFSGEGSNNVAQKVFTYLNTIKVCPYQDNSCLGKDYNPLGGPTLASAILADGSVVSIASRNRYGGCDANGGTGPLVNYCGDLGIKLYGNKTNRKINNFLFRITQSGIIPRGTSNDSIKIENCTEETAGNCTAWVLQKENLDFIKRKVSWQE